MDDQQRSIINAFKSLIQSEQDREDYEQYVNEYSKKIDELVDQIISEKLYIDIFRLGDILDLVHEYGEKQMMYHSVMKFSEVMQRLAEYERQSSVDSESVPGPV